MPDIPEITIKRFSWIQEFAASLIGLGASESPEKLIALGENLYQQNRGLHPARVARAVWSSWPASTAYDGTSAG
jgi:hypothetical protein